MTFVIIVEHDGTILSREETSSDHFQVNLSRAIDKVLGANPNLSLFDLVVRFDNLAGKKPSA